MISAKGLRVSLLGYLICLSDIFIPFWIRVQLLGCCLEIRYVRIWTYVSQILI